jgi:hypothetical protein
MIHQLLTIGQQSRDTISDTFLVRPDALNDFSKEIGVGHVEFESVFLLSSNDMSYAFNLAVPGVYGRQFKKASDEMMSAPVSSGFF